MPTDLPKNFHGTDPLGLDRKTARKLVLKSMRHSLWQLAKGLLTHYVICLAGVAVIAASGFSSVPKAAVSATALGLLARWFLPNQARTQAQQSVPRSLESMGVVELTPEQLREFMAGLDKATEGETVNKHTGPYL